MTRRSRLDVALVERSLVASREQARGAILAGDVRVNGGVVTKAGALVSEDDAIDLAARPRYVSRGGLKLEAALDAFGVDAEGRRAVDIGASTGGFTDCLLQRGAAHVVAIDVGYGQLAWSLRVDPRVTVIERTNIRRADPEAIGAPFDLAVADLSFISLGTVSPAITSLMADVADLVVLVKPQFEVGKGRVGKKGVVRSAEAHADVLEGAAASLKDAGLVIRGVTHSPITGPAGNIEFWIHASRTGAPTETAIADVVAAAHRELGG